MRFSDEIVLAILVQITEYLSWEPKLKLARGCWPVALGRA
jgi:hypothetical protein